MVDLQITNDGELVVGPNGDLAVVTRDEQIAQEVLFRLKTTVGDWLLSPNIGTSLEDFIGEPNELLTHLAIESRVLASVTQNDLLLSPRVDAIAIGENEVFILVEFNSLEDDDRIIQIQSGLDLRKGLVFSRITYRDLQ